MPEHDDQERADEPRFDSDRPTDQAKRLRRVSDGILEEIAAIRHLEVEARKLNPGSPEFARISAEITTRTRAMFMAAGEQEALAGAASEADPPIEEVDTGGKS